MALVLVVDDSAVDRRLVGGLIEKSAQAEVLYAMNGNEALEHIRQRIPDLVLTDLQMPDLDGLELVAAIRAQFPLVPVILMTAHGSEEVAVQALHRGAASYVPKSRLAALLPETVDAVLALAKADRHHDRLFECLKRSEAEFELENDSSLVYPLVDQLQQMVTRMKLCDETGRIRVGVALEEALLNALYHGNLEISAEALQASRAVAATGGTDLVRERRNQSPYRERRIHVRVIASAEEARFIVRDEGPGFNPEDVPDPTDPANLERESGRGLLLMRTFMDEVMYNETGNEVTLVKRRDPESSASESK